MVVNGGRLFRRVIVVRLNFWIVAVLCSSTFVARADVINFDAQAAAAPGGFTGTVNSPLAINGVTFTGGQLLNHEIGASPDQTGVYATVSPNFVPGGYTDPLPIGFSTPVSGFSILVTNVLADTFTVSDNLGGSQSFAIGSNGQQLFTLLDTGITSVTVSSANHAQWDFAIDNVTFTPSAVPEPTNVVLVLTVLGATVALSRRRVRRDA